MKRRVKAAGSVAQLLQPQLRASFEHSGFVTVRLGKHEIPPALAELKAADLEKLNTNRIDALQVCMGACMLWCTCFVMCVCVCVFVCVCGCGSHLVLCAFAFSSPTGTG